MTALFTLPGQTPLYIGAVVPGATLTFSQTLTSTPQNTYTTEALSVAHPNPMTADSAGTFAPIYLDPTLPSYRAILKTAAGVVIAQWDGIPSNQNVQQSLRLESTNPNLLLYDTDGTANARKYRIRAAGNAFEVQAANDAENSFTTILQFTGGVLYSNSTEVAVTSSGSFTGILTGMSGTVTGTINYRKINNVVFLWTSSAITGTSNANDLTITGVPAAIQTVNFQSASCVLQDNGNSSMLGRAGVFGSVIGLSIAKSNAIANYIQYDTNGFTTSGTKGLVAGWAISYVTS